MPALSVAQLLDAWERALSRPLIERALILLAAATPDASHDQLAQLPIGQRNAALLDLRELLFGSQLTSVTDCPNCGERLELSFNVADLRVETKLDAAQPLTLRMDGYELQFRLPNTFDLLALADQREVENARRALLQRVMLNVSSSHAQSSDQLPAFVIDALSERMAEADPQANIQLGLVCPNCAHAWQANFDIVAFLWGELNAWALRVLREVHTLASTYGWSERDILALTPRRRQIYLEHLTK